MTTFQELDVYLSQDFSEDYWADDASLYARELVKQLTTEDWNALKSSWQNRSKQWQVRCAEILDWGEARQAVPLLLEMIQGADDELTLTAADSLRSIVIAELDLSISEDVLERLQAVARTGSIAKRIVNELLKQLQVKAYRSFLMQVLQATHDSQGAPQVVYPLLHTNLDKLDDNFAHLLQGWAITILPEVEIERAKSIAIDIVNFSNLIQQFPLGIPASNLEIAITGYEVAATVLTRRAFAEEWATIQNNLGNVYCNRIRGDSAENLEMAISCYLAALQVRTRQALPQYWADTQINLGNAYSDRIRGERAENLETAIRCYSAALEVYTHGAFPERWATTQNNLGETYRYRIRGERAENLEAAIRCFSSALEIYTHEAFPEKWAGIQNNLGNAYSIRIRGERAKNLEAAIRYYLAVLEEHTRQAFPQQWAITQNNLGNAYSNRIQGDKTENLEAAIRYYLAALEVHTRQAFPRQWAITQNNLGNAYSYRIRGEKAENLEAAIKCYLAALEVYTYQAFPPNWAMIQNNLGVAYRNRIRGEKVENLEAAIRYYLAALEVYTRQAFPQNYAETQFNLGLAYQDAQQFLNAYTAFAAAIDTVELLRGEIVSGDEVKQKLAQEWNKLYQAMVEVCLELHDYAQAIEYVERSQARNLVELIAKPDLYPEGNIPADIPNELDRLRQEITYQPHLIDMEQERRRRGILTWKSAYWKSA